MADFGAGCKKADFHLDPNHTFLNHGSVGAVPRTVMAERMRQQHKLEFNPDEYFRQVRPIKWEENVSAAADFLHADRDDVTLVPNATTAINCVIKSWPFKPGEAIMINSWTYNAVRNICHSTINRAGAELVSLTLELPIKSTDDLVKRYRDFLLQHPNVKMTVIDVISSGTAVKFPFKELVSVCKEHNVLVMADGAHSPGQLPINLNQMAEMGLDFYTGVFHKWMYCPRGCGVLWVNPKHHGIVRPVITSHNYQEDKLGDFYQLGTTDLTQFFVLKDAIAFYQEKGGMDVIVNHNSTLLDQAVDLLMKTWNTCTLPVPKHMEAPNMRMVKLPVLPEYPAPDVPHTTPEWDMSLMRVFHDQGVTIPTIRLGNDVWLRLSAQIYNCIDDYEKLAQVVHRLQQEQP